MNELIEKAIAMIKNHDWYWMMCDFGYNDSLKVAENDRNQFAKLINSISNTQISETLRKMWIANYNLAAAYRSNRNISKYKAEIEILSNQLNLVTL